MSYLSAGVYIKEFDNSTIVPNVSTSMSYFAGNFTKGAIEEPFVVTNKTELENNYGIPTNTNYNEWFQCSKLLDYSNQLTISRAYTAGTWKADSTNDTLVTVTSAASIADTTLDISSIGSLTIGDIIALDASVDPTQVVYIITDFNIVTPSITISRYDLATESKIVGGLNVALSSTESLFKIDYTRNASGLAISGRTSTVTPVDAQVSNILVKNDSDFEIIQDSFSFSSLEEKVRFIARTAGDVNNGIEIAIANSYDFIDYKDSLDQISDTKAEAFEGVSLNSLFDYIPVNEEIAVIIRQGDIIESYIVSFDETSVDANNKSKYIENVINENSSLVYAIDNKSESTLHTINVNIDGSTPTTESFSTYIISHIFADSQGSTKATPMPVANPNTVIGNISLSGGLNPEVSIGDIRNAYFEVENKELFEIDIIIGNEKDEASAAIELANNRADCIAFVGALYSDTVGKKSAQATQNLVNYITRNASAPMRTMFATFFGNYVRIYDNYNKKYRWINIAGDAAGLRANTNTNQASWWSSAGLKRGVIRNIDKLAFSPNQAQRDSLYKNSINPIVNLPGEGNVCMGQKTLLGISSSFDRVNVRSLFNTLERAMSKAARSSLFEFNDAFTRNGILAMFNPYLSTVKAGRGVEDFLVICDTTNNTPDVISRNELVTDILIKPPYSTEFINLNFNNVGTRSFASVTNA